MRLSLYLQAYIVEPGMVGLYSPFGHEITYVNAVDWQRLQAGRLDLVARHMLEDLVERKFLVHEGFEKTALDGFPLPDEGIREMWLVLIQSCNMACQYCVVEGNVENPGRRAYGKAPGRPGGEKRVDVMSPEVAEAAVVKFRDYISRTKPPFPRVTLYGGEPLLNRKVIEHVVPLIRAINFDGQIRPDPVQILVITNGLLFDGSLADFFRQNRVSVSVSLDGMKRHHDAVRVLANGAGTFDQAAETLKRYQDAGVQTGICTTIGSHNVNDLPEIAEYFATDFHCPVEFQVPYNIPHNGGNGFHVDMADAAPKAMEAFRRLRERGLPEGLAARRLIQVARGAFHYRDCSAVGGQWVVAPDGMIGPCHSMVGDRRFFSGDVRSPDCNPLSEPQFNEWWKRSPVNMPECRGCSAIAICGGGCPYNALVNRGSIWAKDPQQCEYMRYLVDWLIADTWERVKAVRTGEAPRPIRNPPVRKTAPHEEAAL